MMRPGFLFVLCTACASTGSDGGFARELRGGALTDRAVAIDLAKLTDTGELAPALDALALSPELGPVSVTTTARVDGLPLVHALAHQEVDGIPIEGTWFALTFEDRGGAARLVAAGYHLYEAPHVDTEVTFPRMTAIAVAEEALGVDPDAPVRDVWLVIAPRGDTLEVAWSIVIAGAAQRALVIASGDRAGEVMRRDDRVSGSDGTVEGTVAIGHAPGNGPASAVPLTGIAVDAGDLETTTGADGAFAIAGDGEVRATLAGDAAVVHDAGGDDLAVTHAGGHDLTLVLGGTTEGAVAQATAYDAIARTRAYAIAAGLPAGALGPVTAYVNVASPCTATFDPDAHALVFSASGDGCRDSAEASLVAHEYGHVLDDAFGGIQDRGLSEGWGDVVSCLSRGAPVIVEPDGALRRCDNDDTYPAGGDDEPHALGQVWSGFVWDLREALVGKLGPENGAARVAAVVLPSLVSNAPDIPSAVREVFLRDDDDWAVIYAAARRHGLTFALDD